MQVERSRAGSDIVPIRVTSAIGEPAEAFPAGMGNIATAYVLAAFFAAAGLAAWGWTIYKSVELGGNLPPFAPGIFSRDTAIIFGVLGLVGIGIAAVAFLYAGRLRARALWAGPGGLYVADSRAERAVPWEAIRLVEEMEIVDKMPLRGPLGHIPIGVNTSYHVHYGESESVHFNKDSVLMLERLGRLLKKEAELRQIAWKVTRVS